MRMDNQEANYLLAAASMLILGAAHFVGTTTRRERRWKTRPIYTTRYKDGFYRATFLPMKEKDHDQFFKYTRMTVKVFNSLYKQLEPKLIKRRISDRVCPEEKIAITLQYLSQGVSMQSLAWSYKMGLTTVHSIIHEVCKVIWEVLSPQYLQEPNTGEWQQIFQEFYKLWNFPNCIGALDGKHINMQAPANSGSLFFNYKKTHSVVLLASCDTHYIFKLVDIGAYGSQSDGGIFKNSVFGQRLESGSLNVPDDNCIPKTNLKVPYALVADEAFPLKKYIMRPYGGRHLTMEKRIFNYRLSRARKMIENTFGILVARWRILKQTIVADVANIDHMVKAVVVLHNFCLKQGCSNIYCPSGCADANDEDNGQWRSEVQPLTSVGRLSTNTAARLYYQIRDVVCQYFSSAVGALPWQNERALRR